MQIELNAGLGMLEVFTDEDLYQEGRDLADLLETFPGLEVMRSTRYSLQLEVAKLFGRETTITEAVRAVLAYAREREASLQATLV